jgi:hypothetical protein
VDLANSIEQMPFHIKYEMASVIHQPTFENHLLRGVPMTALWLFVVVR